jgi:hypothetical protein
MLGVVEWNFEERTGSEMRLMMESGANRESHAGGAAAYASDGEGGSVDQGAIWLKMVAWWNARGRVTR